MPRAIVSIHTPKAAGTTLLELLRQGFGEAAVLMDYEDDPANPGSRICLDPQGWLEQRPRSLPEGTRVAHGHFHASKYDLLPEAFRFTFLRHPLENILSIYSYWRQIPPQPSSLHQYFLRQGLDVLGLAGMPLLQRLYSGTYFGGWDMGRMDFVGRHETRSEGLQKLGKMLGLSLDPALHLNLTDVDSTPEREALKADSYLMSRLTDLLAEDIRFYEKHAQ